MHSHLMHPIFVALGESVLAMRALRLLGYVAVAFGLTWVADRLLRSLGVALTRREWWFVLLVAQAGTLMAWSYPPRYVGYNELSAWLSSGVWGALALGLFPRTPDSGTRRLIPWFVCGLLIVLLVLGKVTSAVAWAVLVVVVCLVPVPGTPTLRRLTAALLGLAVGAALLTAAGMPYLDVIRNTTAMFAGSSELEGGSHDVGDILTTYVTSTVDTGREAALPVLLFVVLLLLCTLLRQAHWVWGVLGVLLVAGFGLTLVPSAVEGSWVGLGGIAGAIGASAGLALLLVVGRAGRSGVLPGSSAGRVLVVLVVGIVTPLVASVGTNNKIWGHAVYTTTPWAVLLGVGLCLVARTAPAQLRVEPLLLGLVVVALGVTAVSFDASRHPYRTSPLWEQSASTSVPSLAGVRMTEQEAQIADWLDGVARAETPEGVPAVSLGNPGFLFIFNASGWASPWRGAYWRQSIAANCADAPPAELYVLEPGTASGGPDGDVAREKEGLQAALQECDLDFPADFTSVAEHDGAVVWHYPSD